MSLNPYMLLDSIHNKISVISMIKEAMKLYYKHSMCMVIIFYKRHFYKATLLKLHFGMGVSL